MLGTVISAIVGSDIDRRDGDGGAVGAVLGIAGWAVVKRIIPLAIIGAGILVAKHYLTEAGLDKPG